jgi:SHS2 domain-containing protein
MSYQVVEHTADYKILVRGKTLADLFQSALIGMMDFLKPTQMEKTTVSRLLKIASADHTTLLIDFLSEVLLLANTHKEIYHKVDFKKLGETELEAKLVGHKVKEFKDDIKGVTYHEAEIKQSKNGGLETAVVFDI